MKRSLVLNSVLCLLGTAALVGPQNVRANVRVPSVIGDHMVLQQQASEEGGVWIWGHADWNETVEVKLGSATARAVGDFHGNWACKLTNLPPAGGPYDLTITGKNTLAIHDVVVGEVWLCSGQSNMEFNVNNVNDRDAEIAAADYPMVRIFKVNRVVEAFPTDDPKGEWQVCSPKTIPWFTAVGYFFGRELHKSLHAPVGLIDSSWGGTPAETWTPLAAMSAHEGLRPIAQHFYEQVAATATAPLKVAEYDAKLTEFKAKENSPTEKIPSPRDPRDKLYIDQNSASTLYNGMIAPLMPYTMRGAIWYQGESNADRANQYQLLLSTMIESWRQGFAGGDFPFYIVQLANFKDRKPSPADSDWAALREAQTKTGQTVPHSGVASAIDIGDAKDIHPRNKQEVGRRLALLAQARTYGQTVVDQGPVYKGMKVEGNKVRVSFQLSTSALASHTGEKLKGFALAGEDHRFAFADAVIEGDEVVISADRITTPVAVRYGWADNPEVGLYNEAGLPASPFRTDDWTKTSALPEAGNQ